MSGRLSSSAPNIKIRLKNFCSDIVKYRNEIEKYDKKIIEIQKNYKVDNKNKVQTMDVSGKIEKYKQDICKLQELLDGINKRKNEYMNSDDLLTYKKDIEFVLDYKNKVDTFLNKEGFSNK